MIEININNMEKHLQATKLKSEIKSQFDREQAKLVYQQEYEIQMEVNVQRQIMKKAEIKFYWQLVE